MRGIFLIIALGLAVLLPGGSMSDAATNPQVPKFKNIDEAIGWVKAKGDCKILGEKKQGSECSIRVELPEEKYPNENRGESVWALWAWLVSWDYPPHRNFSVTIVRSSHFLLSANDSQSKVRSVRISKYHFEYDGKIVEVRISSSIYNFNGEVIYQQEIEIPLGYGYGDGIRDRLLMQNHLGIGWIPWFDPQTNIQTR